MEKNQAMADLAMSNRSYILTLGETNEERKARSYRAKVKSGGHILRPKQREYVFSERLVLGFDPKLWDDSITFTQNGNCLYIHTPFGGSVELRFSGEIPVLKMGWIEKDQVVLTVRGTDEED